MKTAKPAFTAIAPNLAGGGDPSVGRNPTVIRSTWTTQEVITLSFADPPSKTRPSYGGIVKGDTTGMLTGSPARATAQIVLNATGNGYAEMFYLKIGNYILRSGNDTSVGVGKIVGDFQNAPNPAVTVGDASDNLAIALNALGFKATSNGAGTVDIEGDIGPDSNYSDMIISYHTDGKVTAAPIASITQFSGGAPTMGPPVIS